MSVMASGTGATQLSIRRSRFASSIAVTAASAPLLPALVPARSIACSMVSVVSTPKATGTPVSLRDAREPAGAFARDVVEVRGRALDHGAERDDRVVAAALRRACAPPAAGRTRPARARSRSACRSRRGACSASTAPRTSCSTMKSLKRDARIAKRSSRHCRSPSMVLMDPWRQRMRRLDGGSIADLRDE